MIRSLLIVALASTAFAGGLPLRSKRIDDAVAKLQPAVVKIFGAKGFRGIYGYMTGVIVHESGLVITRRSVTLEETDMIRCHLHDGRRVMAEIVREDRVSKMVLLRFLGDPDVKYPVAPLGTSANVRPGQFVLLLGNAYKVALGTERCAVNFGMVSAFTKLQLRSRMFDYDYPGRIILHDAMNNPGVYGGPLVDMQGKVIGISGILVESRDTNAQVHYAIPIDDLKPFIDDTIRRPSASKAYVHPDAAKTDERKDAPPGYHGIRILKGGINRATPAYIDRVAKGSPAFDAGLRPDDLILRVDESRVKSWRSFTRVMKTYRAGDTAKLTVQRGKEIKHFILKLEERKP